MPNFQHRSGLPSSTRNNNHTRWEREAGDRLNWADWLLILTIFVGLLCAVCGITVWS